MEGFVVLLKSYYPHTLFDYDHYLLPEVSRYKILNLWLSITLLLLSKIHALKGMLLIWNIWKHPQNGNKGNHEWKQKRKINWAWCIMPSLSKEKDIIVRGTQVLLDVDQRGHVKQKSSDLSSNWWDLFFNLTKGLIRSLL